MTNSRLLAAGAALLGASLATAQVSSRHPEVSLFPQAPSVVDPVYVTFQSCGYPWRDAEAVFRQVLGTTWAVEVGATHAGPCLLTPLSNVTNAVRIPPELIHDITTLDVVLVGTDGSIRTTQVYPRVQHQIPLAITGSWTSEGMPSQGLLLSHAEVPHPSPDVAGRVAGIVVNWNTFDADGSPLWLVGMATLHDFDNPAQDEPMRVAVPLWQSRGGSFASGQRTPQTTPWGRIELVYLGCGELDMHWQADGTPPDAKGSARFRQLSYTHACALEQTNASRMGLLHEIPVRIE